MPLSTGHKNKMKQWRRESPGNHVGRKMKQYNAMQSSGSGPVAPELLVGLFSRAGIRMPKAEMFKDMLARFKADADAKQAVAETPDQPITE